MDLATLVGIIGAFSVVIASMVMGGSAGMFINVPSLMIVLVGTLVDLVATLASMDDPKSIGPAMAVALLTTLYGAMFANMFALPIADKLGLRREEEGRVKSMIIDALLAIQGGQNPRVIDSMLKAYLPESMRAEDG